ncbi:MAG: peptidylprolyl isomerase, partial [Rubripirellula sp.]
EVSQIFIQADMRDAASAAAAEANVALLAQQIRENPTPVEAFADAAMQHSEAPTAANGGKVGWVKNDGDMPGDVMQSIRGAKAGTVAGPIRSPLGIHLVFVHQEEAGKLGFDDLTDQAQLRRDAANALFDALIRQQADAKISWFVSALRPPASVSIIPN